MTRTGPNPTLGHQVIDSYSHLSPDPAPLTRACERYPHVRLLLTRSRHNTPADVRSGRVTADVVEQAVNYLIHGR